MRRWASSPCSCKTRVSVASRPSARISDTVDMNRAGASRARGYRRGLAFPTRRYPGVSVSPQ
eukprot:scaffold80238_cov69-Phaeocystis_antarctica.AAC.1